MNYTKATIEDGIIKGWLVRYSDEKNTDLHGDYFDSETNFGFETEKSIPVFFQHGMFDQLGPLQIAEAVVKKFDEGIFIEAVLDIRDKYLTELEKKKIKESIYGLAKSGDLGWSSGCLPNMYVKQNNGNATYIKQWILSEASLTPNPAEPNNQAEYDEKIKKQLEEIMKKIENNEKELVDMKKNLEAEKVELEVEVETTEDTTVLEVIQSKLEKIAANIGSLNERLTAIEEPTEKTEEPVEEEKALEGIPEEAQKNITIVETDNEIKNKEEIKMNRTDLSTEKTNKNAKYTPLGDAIVEAVIKTNQNWSAEEKESIRKNVIKSMSVGSLVDGAGMIQEAVWDEVIKLLHPKSIFRASGVPFYPTTEGNLTFNLQTDGMTAEWIDGISPEAATGENKPQFAQRKLTTKKMRSVSSYIDRDLIRRASFDVAGFVQEDMIQAVANLEDLTFLYGTGQDNTIKGIYNWAPAGNKFDTNTTPTVATIRTSLAEAYDKLASANIPMNRPVWYMHPTTKNGLRTKSNSVGVLVEFAQEIIDSNTIYGYPIFESTMVNKDHVFLVDVPELFGADEYKNQVKIDETSKMDLDQIRMILFHSVGLTVKRPAGIAVIEKTTNWGFQA